MDRCHLPPGLARNIPKRQTRCLNRSHGSTVVGSELSQEGELGKESHRNPLAYITATEKPALTEEWQELVFGKRSL